METFLLVLKIVLIALGGALGLVILLVVIGFLSGLFTGHKDEYQKDSPFYRFVLNSMTGLTLFLAGARLVSKGKPLPEGRFVLVSNHRSNFDPIVTWYKFRKTPISFVTKPSNLKIPFYGNIVKRCLFLPIDRQNARNAVKTIDKAADYIKNDVVSIGIYPEGTRSKTFRLLRFHNGAFKIAQKAGVPIVVLCLTGAEKIKDNWMRRRSEVTLNVAEIIPPERHMGMTTNEIGAEVRGILLKALSEAEPWREHDSLSDDLPNAEKTIAAEAERPVEPSETAAETAENA